MNEIVITDPLSSVDTENDEIMSFTGGAYAYFVSDEMVYSIYRCILLKNEVISQNVFRRPLDCAILLLSAGHFCGGIFKKLVLFGIVKIVLFGTLKIVLCGIVKIFNTKCQVCLLIKGFTSIERSKLDFLV